MRASSLARRRVLSILLLGPLLAVLASCEEPPDATTRGGNGTAAGGTASPSDPGGTPGAPVPPTPTNPGGTRGSDAGPLTFTDVTSAAGIHFKHNSGAAGKKYLPETMGAGCAFLDYDNDGWQDVFVVNSANWPENKGAKTPSALYHNNHDGTFADVTSQAGLGGDYYGLGCAVADFDNDGFDDLYLTCVGANHLFRNAGNGTFQDVSSKAGVGDPGFSTSAAWFDYDKDGKLDLFVCNYVEWSVATDVRCALDGKNKSYCTPEAYKGQSPTLYHNRGNGTFENVTKRAGLFDPTCKSLGVALVDFDGDGWLDLFVANDTQPNKLYRNKGDGTFVDTAVEAGVAFSDTGATRGGMGVDAAFYDGSGRQGLALGNFSNEMMSVYSNDGGGLFTDQARNGSIGKATAQSVTLHASSSTMTWTGSSICSRSTVTSPTTLRSFSRSWPMPRPRSCFGTRAAASTRRLVPSSATSSARPSSDVARRTATSTTTATSTCSSVRTTARSACCETTAETVTTCFA